MSADTSSEGNQTILQHLDELRRRVVWAVVGLGIGVGVAFFFAKPLLGILTQPFCQYLVLPGESAPAEATCSAQLVTLRPTEALETYFKIALATGAALAMPFILYQIWLFIVPGLEKHEKRYAYIFVPAATLLFGLGVAFAWFVLLPPAIFFLVNFLADAINNQWQLDPYISFTTAFLFWIGVSFEMPLLFYFLARLGVVTAGLLREQWQAAVVAIALLAALITPSVDPITMLLTMAPLLVLYAFSIVLARIGERQLARSLEN